MLCREIKKKRFLSIFSNQIKLGRDCNCLSSNNASVYCVVSHTFLLKFFVELGLPEIARAAIREVDKRIIDKHVYCRFVLLKLEENSQTRCAEK